MKTALAGEVYGALAAVSPLAGQWVQSAAGRQVGTAGVATDLREEAGRPAFWVDIGGDQFRWSGDSTASGFQLNRTLFALGSDVYATRDLNQGAGFSSVNSRVGATNGSGSVEEKMVFAYGRYRLGDYAVDGIVGYGTTTASKRSATIRSAWSAA